MPINNQHKTATTKGSGMMANAPTRIIPCLGWRWLTLLCLERDTRLRERAPRIPHALECARLAHGAQEVE